MNEGFDPFKRLRDFFYNFRQVRSGGHGHKRSGYTRADKHTKEYRAKRNKAQKQASKQRKVNRRRQ